MTAAFEDITDQQLTALKVRTGMQRMDSTQLASNILDMSRLPLLVGGAAAVAPGISPADQARYAEVFAPFFANKASQYVYHVKGTEARPGYLRRVGQALADVLATLAAGYAQEPIYQVLQRLLAENFRLEAGSTVAKANCEISAGCLQSLDDQEATYRSKAGQPFKGYVANVTETCDPANTVQLITDVRVAPNTTDDETLLLEAVPQLQARMELDALYTDGGFTGPQADQTLRERHITHIPSAIRGEPPATDRLHLADFEITQDAQGQPRQLTCPRGQMAPVTPTRTQHAASAPNLALPLARTAPCGAPGAARSSRGGARPVSVWSSTGPSWTGPCAGSAALPSTGRATICGRRWRPPCAASSIPSRRASCRCGACSAWPVWWSERRR